MKVVEGSDKKVGILPWILGFFVSFFCVLAWGSNLGWSLQAITVLTLFPLLGLLAWSLMWTHYAFGALKTTYPKLTGSRKYDTTSKALVLGLILLHPGMIIWQQWNVNDLLPPGSVYGYVGSSLKTFVIFGVLALLIFLSFEIFVRLKDRPKVRRNWIYISVAQMLAMSLIFAHAIALGGVFDQEWFLFFWVSLGALLIPCFALVGMSDWNYSRSNSRKNAGGSQDG